MRAQIPREIVGGWPVPRPLAAPSLLGWDLGWAAALFWRCAGDWRPSESFWGRVGVLLEELRGSSGLVLELGNLHW